MGPGRRRTRRERLDRLMVSRGLARTRERAQAMILAGVVRVDGQLVDKSGAPIFEESAIDVISSDHPFVGRGGVKLQGALDALGIDPAGRVALDVGASTGGFTDCLLQRGAERVHALDVGKGQLDWSLRNDPRVVLMEGRNARYLRAEDLPEPIDLAVVDVSFISLRLILPVLPPLLRPRADVVPLVKPQFEVGRGEVGPGGIVRDPGKHLESLKRIAQAAEAAGLPLCGACSSPIHGAEGNREFFLHLGGTGSALSPPERIELFERIVHDDR